MPYFRQTILEKHCMDTDSIAFSLYPVKGLINDLKQFTKEIDNSALDPSHEL